jgi:hypothetical protein
MVIVGLENFYTLAKNNKNFELFDFDHNNHIFRIMPGSNNFLHVNTATGDTNIVHKDTIKLYIESLFQEKNIENGK